MISLFPAPLARSLRDDLLTERQKLSCVLGLLFMSYVTRVLRGDSHYSVLLLSVYLVISVIGTAFTFRTNARGDNRNFIERWACLHFSLSLLVVYVPQFLLYGLYVLLFWTYGRGVVTAFQKLSPILMFLDVLLLTIEYFLLNFYTRVAASGPASPSETTFAPIATP